MLLDSTSQVAKYEVYTHQEGCCQENSAKGATYKAKEVG